MTTTRVRTDDEIHADGLLTQTEARREAKARNERGDYPDGMCNIAIPVPFNSWGGHEKGWAVTLAPADKSKRRSRDHD